MPAFFLVMGPPQRDAPVRFRVTIDGKSPGSAHGTEVDADGAARRDARPTDGVSLVSLMRHPTGDPHLEAYAESQYPLRLGWSPLAALRE